MQWRGCCSVSCSPFKAEMLQWLVSRQVIVQNKSLCNLRSGLPTYASTQLGIGHGSYWEVCACAFCILSQADTATGLFLDSSANLLSQPVSITPQQAEAAVQEVPQTSANSERWVPLPTKHETCGEATTPPMEWCRGKMGAGHNRDTLRCFTT